MEVAKLLLDYLKVLLWPLIVVVIILLYEDEVIGLLENREIEILGLKIGQRIESLSENYATEIAEIREIVEKTSGDPQLLSRINKISRNIQKDLSQIQQQAKEPNLIERRAVSSILTAAEEERLGFQAILDQNIDLAIKQFTAARELWADYHNVAEIETLLKQQQSILRPNALSYQQNWKVLKQRILKDYSWGMPKDIREQLKQQVR